MASILRGLEEQDKLAISHNLREYKELLAQHIKKKTRYYAPGLTGTYPLPRSMKCLRNLA